MIVLPVRSAPSLAERQTRRTVRKTICMRTKIVNSQIDGFEGKDPPPSGAPAPRRPKPSLAHGLRANHIGAVAAPDRVSRSLATIAPGRPGAATIGDANG